jgi:ribosomal protein S18 acetylase RimI-like enzyme
MSVSPFKVRRATDKDAAELARLGEVTFMETFGHLYSAEDATAYVASAFTKRACLEKLADSRLAYWLVHAEGEPAVGYALAGYCKLPVPNLEPTAGELRQLYLRSSHQKQRLGTLLFGAAIDWLEARYAPLYIGVWSENFGAQRFYGRHGFVKVGEYGFPVGKTVDREFILKR